MLSIHRQFTVFTKVWLLKPSNCNIFLYFDGPWSRWLERMLSIYFCQLFSVQAAVWFRLLDCIGIAVFGICQILKGRVIGWFLQNRLIFNIFQCDTNHYCVLIILFGAHRQFQLPASHRCRQRLPATSRLLPNLVSRLLCCHPTRRTRKKPSANCLTIRWTVTSCWTSNTVLVVSRTQRLLIRAPIWMSSRDWSTMVFCWLKNVVRRSFPSW